MPSQVGLNMEVATMNVPTKKCPACGRVGACPESGKGPCVACKAKHLWDNKTSARRMARWKLKAGEARLALGRKVY